MMSNNNMGQFGNINMNDLLNQLINQIIVMVKQKYPYFDIVRDNNKLIITIKKDYILQKITENIPSEMKMMATNFELTPDGLKITTNIDTFIYMILSMQNNLLALSNKGA